MNKLWIRQASTRKRHSKGGRVLVSAVFEADGGAGEGGAGSRSGGWYFSCASHLLAPLSLLSLSQGEKEPSFQTKANWRLFSRRGFGFLIGFGILCKLPLKEETICMECQSLFCKKIRKISSICHLLNLVMYPDTYLWSYSFRQNANCVFPICFCLI